MKLKLLVLVAGAAMMLCGCGVSTPREEAGRKLLQHLCETQSKGRIKVVSFTKTNATQSGDVYHLEFEAQIEFLETGERRLTDIMDPFPSFEFRPPGCHFAG
jgi:hypothetical protein